MYLKLLQKESFKKTAKGTADLMSNKIPNRITKVSVNSQQNISKTVTNEHDKKIAKERHVYPEERPKIIDELILVQYINEISKNSQQNNSEIFSNENDKKYLKKDMYLHIKRQKIDNLR